MSKDLMTQTIRQKEYEQLLDDKNANIENGTLQVSQDIEVEIAEVERGEKVSMQEFNSMFAKWLN